MIVWYLHDAGGVDRSRYNMLNYALLYQEIDKDPQPSDCVWLVPGTVDPMQD